MHASTVYYFRTCPAQPSSDSGLRNLPGRVHPNSVASSTAHKITRSVPRPTETRRAAVHGDGGVHP
ncbi:hypothetical protein CERSUDRAFT_85141 [Gelatoporia subvermispora B]|uniref:Uncharacterized protein n=1 Tax=Ceriporiopsis subvermispora (strain B) TaxID=914234 RepID=M2RB76_CERS8|nr:hypothetical protein CERSUDRAFT_85141 [Gelatoporia subvermispora B]